VAGWEITNQNHIKHFVSIKGGKYSERDTVGSDAVLLLCGVYEVSQIAHCGRGGKKEGRNNYYKLQSLIGKDWLPIEF